ncbi:pyocin knob domain-containing protein, partial [Chryseobacterium taichungense]
MSDIKYALYTSSKGFKVVGGIAAQFLKADGSVDANSYIPAGTDINMADKSINFTTGSLSRYENNSKVIHKVFQKFTDVAQTGILSIKFPQASISATMFDVTIKIYGYQARYLGNLRISFYKQTAILIHPSGHKAVLECSETFPTTVINAGLDAAGNVCINIGEATTFWNTNFAVEVERVGVIYTGRTADWSKGWSMTTETDTSTYQSILNIVPDIVASRTWVDQNNIGSIPKSATVLGSTDLNTVLTPGFYNQLTNSGSILANNYPLEGLFAGSLRVYRTISTGIVQEYQTRSSGGTVTFIRSTENSGASWTAWKKVLTSADFNPSNYYTQNETSNLFVKKSGAETISDTKTFTHSPVIPNGTIGTHAVNKNQIELSATQEGEGGQQLSISGNN